MAQGIAQGMMAAPARAGRATEDRGFLSSPQALAAPPIDELLATDQNHGPYWEVVVPYRANSKGKYCDVLLEDVHPTDERHHFVWKGISFEN